MQHPISYSSSGLLTSEPCNVFNNQPSPISIGGYKHYPCAGGVTFDGTNLVLQTQYSTTTTSNMGTAYAIAFPFKAGYNYFISVNANGTDGSGGNVSFPQLSFSIFNSNPAPAPTDCGAVGQDKWGGLQQNVAGIVTLSSTSQNYNTPSFSIPSAGTPPSYIIVLAYGGSASLNKAFINSITINETPSISFSVSSTLASISCGSTTPITFTATGNNVPAGATVTYNWNLGATPNGWLLPNGSMAPATYSTGTTNNITLTPVCGNSLSNVSVTATFNSTNYNSNTTSVSLTQPTLSISGVSNICSGNSTYTINGLPCNANVAWSISPPTPNGIANLSSLTGTSTDLQTVGNGNVTLTANVTSCGVAQNPITQVVHIGAYQSSDYNLVNNTTNSNFYCVGKSISFSVTGASGTNYNWTLPPGWQTLYGGNGNYYDMILPTTTPTGTVSVSFTEPCGTTVTKNMFLAYSNNVCVNNDPRYGYSPNPAPTSLNVYVNSAYLTNTFFSQIQLVQINTGSTVFSQNYGSYTQNATIYMGNFPSGSYTLKVYDGSVWATYIIMH